MGHNAQPGQDLVTIEGLKKHYSAEDSLLDTISVDLSNRSHPVQVTRDKIKAVDGVSFNIRRGECFGLVGESGCGKSTLARSVLHLVEPNAGSILFDGEDLTELTNKQLRKRRRDFQMVFQDPESSLNPRMRCGEIIEAPMKAHALQFEETYEDRAVQLLRDVGLEAHHYSRYPHELSGGQRQRVNLARALSVNPEFVVCDEPVSALDVSIQAKILNTMKQLQEKHNLTYLFIAHDLSVVRYISDRVGVMYLGKLVEIAETKELYENPKHPYTKSLLDAIPLADPDRRGERVILRGEVPSPRNPPSGCRFRTRCPVLIRPREFDIDEEQWQELLSFTRAVRQQLIDPMASASEIYDQFIGNTRLPDNLDNLVHNTISAIVSGDWDTAISLIDEQIESNSVCAVEEPSYTTAPQHGNDPHQCNCHLVNDDYSE